jgi:hypothetical protein
MLTCENCRKETEARDAFSWLLVMYRPSKSEYLNRAMRRSYNFCSLTCLTAFYRVAAVIDERGGR